MSNDTTTRPASDPAPYRCEHCDDSVPHEHLDVRAVIEDARDTARSRALRRLVGAGIVLAAALVVTLVAAGVAVTLGALALTAAGWVVVTVAALGVVGAARARTSDARALVTGALVSAALVPLVALAVATLVGGRPAAVVVGATWLACGAIAEGGKARTWRALLLTEGDDGERARARAVAQRGRAPQGAGRWLVRGVAVGLAVWLLAAVPAVVLVLVPLSVALTALAGARSARRV